MSAVALLLLAPLVAGFVSLGLRRAQALHGVVSIGALMALGFLMPGSIGELMAVAVKILTVR